MEQFNKDSLKKLAKLSRIACSDDEFEEIKVHLQKIIDHANAISAVDTEGVPPCNHVLESMEAPLRADEEGETIDRAEFLDNSPDHVGGMIRVPQVLS